MGALWDRLEPACPDPFPRVARSGGRGPVPALDYSALPRLPARRAWDCYGCFWGASFAGSGNWSYSERLSRDLRWLAVDLPYHCPNWHCLLSALSAPHPPTSP